MPPDPTPDPPLKVGALARLTGLTVRALHHYEDVGLLTPADRTPAGHRLYGAPEVRRLHQITSLRQLGLSLEEIGRVLDDPDHTLEATLDRQIDGLRGRIREEEELCRQLEVLRDRVRRDGDTVPLDILTRSLSGTVRMENHYSAAQLARLEDRREALGAQGMEAAQTRWAELLDEFTEALADGVPPEDARVQALVQRASSLLDAFTGGDPEIRESLARMYRREGPERVLEGRGMALAPGVWEYMARARAAHDT